MNRLLIMGVVSLLAGCAGTGLKPVASGGPGSCSEPGQEQALALNLAQEMADEGRQHAALANLQKLPQSLPQARLSQARILRNLRMAEAKPMYRSLLGTCLAADGEHGLGQLAAARGEQDEALARLERARSLDPTNARVRNDLGITYLGLGREDAARFEFLTALELDQSDSQPALNLLALLFYQDRWQQAAELAWRLRLNNQQVSSAEALARRLREGVNAAPTAMSPTPELAETGEQR